MGRCYAKRCKPNQGTKFRQYILEHVRQMKKPLNRDNATSIGWVFSRLRQRIAKTSDRDTGVTPRPGGPIWEGTE